MSLRCCSSLALVLSLLVVVSPAATLAAYCRPRPPSKPVLARLNKDPSTSLYTISLKGGGAPLVVDLAGPLVWSTCGPGHRTIPCASSACKVANRNRPAGCASQGGGAGKPGCAENRCSAYPYNPVTGECGRADVTAVPLAANATDGKNPLSPASFSVLGSCAPDGLLASLPSGAAGVAGLSRLPLSLPSQVASALNVAREFALCIPSGGETGAAIFGGGAFQLLAAPPVEVADGLRKAPVPFLKNRRNGAYYFKVTGINVNNVRVPVPAGAFDLRPRSGRGGVVLSTVTPCTTLRSDIYRPLLRAFDAATSGIPRAAPVRPFELCYEASALGSSRLGFAVANIDLLLDGGRSWLLAGGSSLVQVNDHTVCFAFLEMAPATAASGSPAAIFGGFQLEDHLLLVDLQKETFALSGPLIGIRTNCGNFNFTIGSS
ncbi:hypothetical protein ACP4OV_019497 [Aristida adscensionis]